MKKLSKSVKKYKIIYADPPWAYRNMGNIQATANAQYPTMKNEDICALPIGELADDNSILFLWATFPKIQEALDVMKAWGFEYKTVGFTWIKKNKNGGNFFGVGWYTKSNAEVCLIGTKGKAPKISNSISQIIETVRERHSKKPAIVRQKIVEFCGDIPRIELFARQKTKGWDIWGNEIKSDISITK
jgi:site-specific DNA-methyltransferase (adenine-specific)